MHDDHRLRQRRSPPPTAWTHPAAGRWSGDDGPPPCVRVDVPRRRFCQNVAMPAAADTALIAVNLGTPDAPTAAAVRRAYGAILHSVETHAPTARIDGVLVAEADVGAMMVAKDKA